MKQQLLWKAQLENVTDVTIGDDGFEWTLTVKCTSCNETHDKPVIVSKTETSEMPGSRGEANLVMKCKFCRRDLSLDIVAEHREASLNEDSTTVQPLATFEGRGLEVVAFIPKDGFVAKGTDSGHVFDNIDLSDAADGWTDYDDDAKLPVSISEVEFKIKKL